MTLGEKIKTKRVSKGYSQENMAAMLHISPTAFAKIERGETDVNYSRLEEIAKVLETTVVDLQTFCENGYYHMNGSNNGFFANNITSDSAIVLAELQKVKAENEGLKKEVEHLNKIIALLEKK
jgi:transcriptional regulator with XRE-family HTH domain